MSNMAYKVPTTIEEVRDYVSGTSNGMARAADTIMVRLTHSNLTQTQFGEIRVDLRMTVASLKDKLYTQCGTPPKSMQLFVRPSVGGPIFRELSDENATVGACGVRDGQVLHVVDTDPHSLSAQGALENVDSVERYVMSKEDYDKRPNTYAKFRAEKRKTDPTWTATGSQLLPIDVADEAPPVKVGDRAEVFPGARRGEVAYVGKDLNGLPSGWWVGICYDEPVGKNDGSVKGTRYFTAGANYGGFVRPSKVTVGDYPVLEDELSDDEL